MFGYKNHVSIDRAHGFVRRYAVTHAAARLPALLDKTNTASPVWPTRPIAPPANEAHLARHGLRSRIHFRRKPGRDLTPPQRKANPARTAVRSEVKTVFAVQKHGFRLVIRTIGIARATTKIGLANLAYNIRRFIWIKGQARRA